MLFGRKFRTAISREGKSFLRAQRRRHGTLTNTWQGLRSNIQSSATIHYRSQTPMHNLSRYSGKPRATATTVYNYIFYSIIPFSSASRRHISFSVKSGIGKVSICTSVISCTFRKKLRGRQSDYGDSTRDYLATRLSTSPLMWWQIRHDRRWQIDDTHGDLD